MTLLRPILLLILLLALVLPNSSSQASVVAIYSFDNQNGNDSSGNNNHAVGSGAVSITYATTTPFGHGYAYNADNNKFTAAHSASFGEISQQLTVSFWINADASTSANWFRIMRKSHSGESQMETNWIISRNSNFADVLIRTDIPSAATNQNRGVTNDAMVLDGQWHLVTYILNNGSYVEYLDGVSINSGTYPHGTETGLSNTHPFEMGRVKDNWTGLLDDVGIWSNALTSGEARSIYTLAASSVFNYDLELVTQLHALHQSGNGSLDLNGYTWSYTNALSGSGRNPGDLYYDGTRNQWILQMTSTTSLFATPEPSRAVLAALALLSLSLRRHRPQH